LIYGGLTYPEISRTTQRHFSNLPRQSWLCRPSALAISPFNPECADLEDLISGMSFTTRTLGFVNRAGADAARPRALAGVTVDMSQYESKRNVLCDT